MTGVRDLVARCMVRSGLARPLSAIRTGLIHEVKVLAYHRVVPKLDEQSFAYDLELLSAWQEEFDWQVGFLASNYEVITSRDLAVLMDTGAPIPRRALIITFDDGYRDNHDVALPILRRHNVPAVMFVSTGYIGSDVTFWFDRLAYDLLRTPSKRLQLGREGDVVDLDEDIASRRHAVQRVLDYVKSLPDKQRHATLAQWDRELAVAMPVQDPGLNAPMTWPQVKALSQAGIEIGSHSVTHPVLSKLANVDQVDHELTASKASIEQHTGSTVVSMSYPVGGPNAYDAQVVQAVRRAGYRFAFTYENGSNRLNAWEPYRMRRYAVERYVSRERFCAMLAAPMLFRYKPLGR